MTISKSAGNKLLKHQKMFHLDIRIRKIIMVHSKSKVEKEKEKTRENSVTLKL
jgi:hypothetical protein